MLTNGGVLFVSMMIFFSITRVTFAWNPFVGDTYQYSVYTFYPPGNPYPGTKDYYGGDYYYANFGSTNKYIRHKYPFGCVKDCDQHPRPYRERYENVDR